MVTRTGVPRYPVAPRPMTTSRRFARPRSRAERGLFAMALCVFGICSIWTSLVLLARVYPALFPGQTLTGALPGGSKLADLPVFSVNDPGANSAFNQRINLLVMGVDRRPGDAALGEFRTDTLMVATIDPVTKQASVLSFPRDIEITIHHPDGYTFDDRINASYGVGVARGNSYDAGAQQLMTDIKANFGIDIDYWVLMDFEGVQAMVDAIGGIDIEVPEDLAVYDWWYSDESGEQAHYVSFYPGMQHMTGYDAVAFGRYRESGDGDLDRVRRQQLVLQTAMHRIFEQGLLANPLELWDAYSTLVKTNIPRADLPGLAVLASQSNGDIATYSLGSPVNGVDTVIPFTSEEGAAMLALNMDNVRIILGAMFTKATYAKSWVEIHDAIGGAEGDQKADSLQRYLHFSKGLPTVYIGPDERPAPQTVITVYSEEWRPMAEDIADWLGIPDSSIESAPKPEGVENLDVIITIGQDYRIPNS